MATGTIQRPNGVQILAGTSTAGSDGKGTVTFSTPFSSVPTVIFTVVGPTTSQIFEARPNAITTTDCTYVVARYNGSAIAGYAANVSWVAIGPA